MSCIYEGIPPHGNSGVSILMHGTQVLHHPPMAGDPPLIKVLKEENQFMVYHCQRSLPVLYDANGWVRRAREHPSFRVTVQIVAESKR